MTYTLSDEDREALIGALGWSDYETSRDETLSAVERIVSEVLAAQRESIAQEIEANAPEWEYAGGIARDAHIRIADRIRRDDIARGAQ